MAIRYTKAYPVELGEAPSAWHRNRLARAINDRLWNGVGDPTWRIFWYAHSLMRNVRNPADANTFPAADEWWKFYAFVDPKSNLGSWPVTGPGEPEGGNAANPIVAFTFGRESADLYGEVDRLKGAIPALYPHYTSEAGVHESEKKYPLIRGAGLTVTYTTLFNANQLAEGRQPCGPTEKWELAKSQRGAVDPNSGVYYSPAVDAPRVFAAFRYGNHAPYLKTYTSFQSLPDSGTPQRCAPLCSDCPPYRNFLLKFTPILPGLPVVVFPGTCADVEGHVLDVFEGSDAYYVYVKRGTGATAYRLSYKDYIEGPYSGGGSLAKGAGDQIHQGLNKFVLEFRGDLKQRAATSYQICETGFDFQSFFTRQYSLAPSFGIYTPQGAGQGDDLIVPIYPRFSQPAFTTFTGTTVAHTIKADAFIDTEIVANGSNTPPSGFVCAGYHIYLFRAAPSTTYELKLLHGVGQHLDIVLTTNNLGNAEAVRYLDTTLTGQLQLKNGATAIVLSGGNHAPVPFDTRQLPGRLVCELAFLAKAKPEIPDGYALLRFATAKAASDLVDGRGEDTETPKALSDEYLAYGYIRLPSGVMAQHEQAISTNPIYDACRILLKSYLRMIPRDPFIGYEVADGNSVLYLRRYASSSNSLTRSEAVSHNSPTDGVVNDVNRPLESKTFYVVTSDSGDSLSGETPPTTTTGFPTQENLINYPVSYTNGEVDVAQNRHYVGQIFKTGAFIVLPASDVVVAPGIEFPSDRVGLGDPAAQLPTAGAPNQGKPYRLISWTLTGSNALNADDCLVETSRTSNAVAGPWMALSTVRSVAPNSVGARVYALRDLKPLATGHTIAYRVTVGALRFNANSSRVKLAKLHYVNPPPAVTRYACGATSYSYLCPGRDYIVSGTAHYGVPPEESKGANKQHKLGSFRYQLTEPRIWLLSSATAYHPEFLSFGDGETFTCPAGVAGFSLLPPSLGSNGGYPTDPVASALEQNLLANGSTQVKQVQIPNIVAGGRYLVRGSGSITYNEFQTPANGVACAGFYANGKGYSKAGGTCAEFRGVASVPIAVFDTGREELRHTSQAIEAATGLDMFQGLGPSLEPVASGKIQDGVSYVAWAPTGGKVRYNEIDYAHKAPFTGSTTLGDAPLPVSLYSVVPTTGSTVITVYEHDGIRHSAPMKGETNEWSMFSTFNAYHWSQSSIWKPTAYGDQLCFLHNRCNLYEGDWLSPVNRELLLQFSYGQKPVLIAENPSGYTYVEGTNAPPVGWELNTRKNYFRSCQIYKPDLRVKSATMMPFSDELKVVFDGRIHNTGKLGPIGKMDNIPRNWLNLDAGLTGLDAKLNLVRNEPFKSDENSLLEYEACRLTGCDNSVGETQGTRNCARNKLGDGAAGSVLWGLPDDPFGSCFPRFYLTKAIPYVWPYTKDTGPVPRPTTAASCERNTKLDVDAFTQMELYLRAMAGGYLDIRSTKEQINCNDTTSKLADYSFTNVCFQAITDSATILESTTTTIQQVTERHEITWGQELPAAEPEYSVDRALVAWLADGKASTERVWTSVVVVPNSRPVPSPGLPASYPQSHVDEVSFRTDEVARVEYRVSTFIRTEVAGDVERTSPDPVTFTYRVVSWPKEDLASSRQSVRELGREIIYL